MINNEFSGIFKEELYSYYNFKVANGAKYISVKYSLQNFDRYTVENNILEKNLTKDLINGWITYKEIKNGTQSAKASIMRQFGMYLYNHDIPAFILPKNYYKRKSNFVPHIYTEEEIKRFIMNSDIYYINIDSYKNDIVSLVFRLLCSTGMRIGECLSIKVKNINYSDLTIKLEKTKNGEDRLIVINEDLLIRIKNLINKYKYDFENDYLFKKSNNNIFTSSDFYAIFTKILFKAKIHHDKDGPRMHDFRHTFAVNSFKSMMEQGYTYEETMPLLSTYLGHSDFGSTYKYVRLTADMYPNIRKSIGKRFNNIIPDFEEYDD